MHVLLTGANGFICSDFVKRLPEGMNVTTLGRTPVSGASRPIEHINCDLADPGALASLIASGGLPERIDRVVHMAVSRRHREFPDGALDLFGVNCNALQHLLQYAVAAKASGFVVGSTCSVYVGADTGGEVDETVLPDPTHFWPATKYVGELLALKYQTFFPVSVLRYATPYGPDQEDRLLPDILRRVQSEEAVLLPEKGDGLALRPIYVTDAADVLERAITGSWSGIVNAAGDEVIHLRQLAERIGALTGKTPKFERRASIGAYSVIPSVEELRTRMGGLDTFTSLDDGLTAMLA